MRHDPASSPRAMTADQWAPFLAEHLGLNIASRRWDMCEPAIRRAMETVGVDDPSLFRQRVGSDATAFDALINELTVGETYFFRDGEQFEFLRREAMPELVHREDAREQLIVWSAGCASGEEPYSVAILLREMGLAHRSRIVGTDVSRDRLARARAALYSPWSLRGVPATTVDRYFRKRHARFALVDEIRTAVDFLPFRFATRMDPPPVARAHVILCRNVLIYLDRPTIERTARELMSRLSDGGWLLLGPSDPPLHDLVECEPVVTGGGTAYRRATGRPRYRFRREAGVSGSSAVSLDRALADGAPRSGADTGPSHPPAGMLPATIAARDPGAGAAGGAAPALPAVRHAPVMPQLASVSDAAMLLTQARECQAMRDDVAAASLSQRYVEAAAHDPDGWLVLVRSLANLGQDAVAARTCATGMARHPEHAELAVLGALLMTRLERVDEAVTLARRALYLDRGLAMAHLALGSALGRKGDSAGARRAMLAAVRLLDAVDPDAVVPCSGGERATRLAGVAHAQLALLDRASA